MFEFGLFAIYFGVFGLTLNFEHFCFLGLGGGGLKGKIPDIPGRIAELFMLPTYI